MLVPAIILGLGATFLSACGGDSADHLSLNATSTTKPSGPTYAISTRNINGLGTVIVTGHQRTLYLFEPDQQSSKSTCFDICAAQWPPFVLPPGVAAAQAGSGIKQSLLSTTTRPNGELQVVYNGWPLYLWPPDTTPGQATGQALNNLGGLWYVVSPEGNAIR